MKPKVSLIIPAHNEKDYIGMTLTWAMAQSFKEYEVVVVDNASTDDTAKIVGYVPEVRLIKEPQKGLLNARETGRKEALGEILIYTDADTYMDSDFISHIYTYFLLHPEVVGVGCPYDFYDAPPLYRVSVWVFFQYWKLVDLFSHMRGKGSFLFGNTFAVRVEALNTIGGFNTKIKFYGEDTDTTKRIGKIGKVDFLWNIKTHTSCRRYRRIGAIRTLLTYLTNYISVMLFDKPLGGKQ